MAKKILKVLPLTHANCDALVVAIEIECDPHDHSVVVCIGCGYEIEVS